MTDDNCDYEDLHAGGAWRLWSPLYSLRDHLRGYGFHFAVMIIISTAGILGYHSTLLFADGRGVTTWDPTSTWDTALPAMPWTVLVYLTLYLYLPLPILSAGRSNRGRRELAILGQGMLLLFLISYAFFVFMPAEVSVRTQMEALVPTMHPQLGRIFEIVYLIDRPWNSWPSLHVSQSLLIALFVQRWLTLRAAELPLHRFSSCAMWIAWIVLSLSILTTKQHFIWDMLSGGLLGALIWWSYILPRFEQRATSRQTSSVPSSA
jgi:hypothetical protein